MFMERARQATAALAYLQSEAAGRFCISRILNFDV